MNSIFRHFSPYQPCILLVIVGFMLAQLIMISKVAVTSGVQPLELAFISTLGAGIILIILAAKNAEIPPLSPRHLVLYLVLGCVSFAYPNAVTYFVVDRVGPAYGSIVYSLSPLITFALAALIGIEKMTLKRGLGLAIGLIGVALVVWQKTDVKLNGEYLWILMGLTVPASLAIGNVIRTAYWPKGTSALSFASATLLVSAMLLFVVAIATEGASTWLVKTPVELKWITVMLVTSAVFYVLIFRLQKIAGPVYLSQIGYWGTGFGVVLAALIYGDLVSTLAVGGIALIISGAVLANSKNST